MMVSFGANPRHWQIGTQRIGDVVWFHFGPLAFAMDSQ